MSDTSDFSISFVASEGIADNEDTVLEVVDTTTRNLVASESENGFTYVEDSEMIDLKNNTVYNIEGSNPMEVTSDDGLNIVFVNAPQ